MQTWEQHLLAKMTAAGQRERDIAIAKGDVENGIPFISVIGDGGWSKRTYGHGFGASAGVVSPFMYYITLGTHRKYLSMCKSHCTIKRVHTERIRFKNVVFSLLLHIFMLNFVT